MVNMEAQVPTSVQIVLKDVVYVMEELSMIVQLATNILTHRTTTNFLEPILALSTVPTVTSKTQDMFVLLAMRPVWLVRHQLLIVQLVVMLLGSFTFSSLTHVIKPVPMVTMVTKVPTLVLDVIVSVVNVSIQEICLVQPVPPTTTLKLGQPTVLQHVLMASTAMQLQVSATYVMQHV